MKQLLELKEQVNELEELLVTVNKRIEARIDMIEKRQDKQMDQLAGIISARKKTKA